MTPTSVSPYHTESHAGPGAEEAGFAVGGAGAVAATLEAGPPDAAGPPDVADGPAPFSVQLEISKKTAAADRAMEELARFIGARIKHRHGAR